MEAQPKRLYVLIVEDDPNIASMIGDYLETKGVSWRTECTDALQAVIQAEALNVGVVLMDIMLPGFGSGVDAYKAFRQNPRLAQVPVIFMTAMNEPQARALLPKDDPKVRLMLKPLDLAALHRAILEVAGPQIAARPAA